MLVAGSSIYGDSFEISAEGYIAKKIYLRAGDRIVARFSANWPINFYLADQRNFNLFRQGKKFTFHGTVVPTISFQRAFKAPREDTWFAVIHNKADRAISGSWAVDV